MANNGPIGYKGLVRSASVRASKLPVISENQYLSLDAHGKHLNCLININIIHNKGEKYRSLPAQGGGLQTNLFATVLLEQRILSNPLLRLAGLIPWQRTWS